MCAWFWVGHSVVFLGKIVYFHSTSPPRSINGYWQIVREVWWNGVILQWTDIPSRGVVVLFLVTSSYGNWHKLWPDELLGLSTDFTLTKFHTLTRQYYGVTLISMGNKQNLSNTQNLQYKMTQSTIYSRIINRVKMVLVSNFGKMVHCGSCLKLKNLSPTITGP